MTSQTCTLKSWPPSRPHPPHPTAHLFGLPQAAAPPTTAPTSTPSPPLTLPAARCAASAPTARPRPTWACSCPRVRLGGLLPAAAGANGGEVCLITIQLHRESGGATRCCLGPRACLQQISTRRVSSALSRFLRMRQRWRHALRHHVAGHCRWGAFILCLLLQELRAASQAVGLLPVPACKCARLTSCLVPRLPCPQAAC